MSKFLTFLSILVLVISVFWNATPRSIQFTEDIGLSLAVGDEIRDGHLPLLGPPSHTGGRHLGPIYYLYVAGAETLGGGDPYRTVLVFSILKVLAILLCSYATTRLVPKSYRSHAFIGSVLCACSIAFVDVLRNPWHPHLLLITGTIFLLAFIEAIQRGPKLVGVYLLAATVLLQTHFASAPLILAYSLVLFGAFLKKEVILRQLSKDLLKGLVSPIWLPVLLLLLWLPAIIFEIKNPSNIVALVQGTSEASQIHAGIFGALAHEWAFLCKFILGLRLKHYGTLLVAMILGLGVLFGLKERGERTHDYHAFLVAQGLALLLYCLALSRLSPPLYIYFLFSLLPTLIVFFGASFALGIHYLFGEQVSLRIVGGLYTTLIALCFATSVISNSLRVSRGSVPPFHSLLHAEEIASLIKKHEGNRSVEILTASASKVMNGAFYSLLGPNYFSKIALWNTLSEFPQTLNVSQETNKVRYLIACPEIYSAEIRTLESSTLSSWVWDREFTPMGCSTCNRCTVRRYILP